MAAFINTNTASLNAQRNLTTSQSSLATSLQRLSSGLRINSAKDDAAGLAISDRMTSQIRGLTQAARNANDGISLAQTGEGALSEITNNLQRVRELAVQSANSTNSASDRAALDLEVQQRLSEIDRVSSSTSFNGLKILNGTAGNSTFQIGANVGETISIDMSSSTRTNSIGASANAVSGVALDTLINPTTSGGTPETVGAAATGTIAADLTFASTPAVAGTDTVTFSGAAADTDTVTLNGVVFTFADNGGGADAITVDDANNVTINSDLAGGDADSSAASLVAAITAAKADALTTGALSTVSAAAGVGGVVTISDSQAGEAGTVGRTLARTGTAATVAQDVTGSDADASTNATFSVGGANIVLNEDYAGASALSDMVDDITTQLTTQNATVTASVGTGANAGKVVFTNKANMGAGADPAITAANGNATTAGFTSTVTTAGVDALPADTAETMTLATNEFTVQVGNSPAVSITGSSPFTTSKQLVDAINSQVSGAFASVDSAGKLSIKSSEAITIGGTKGLAAGLGFTAANATAGNLEGKNVLTADGATDLMQRVDSALKSVSTMRSTFGAVQNRFESTISNLQTTSENLSSSRSRIQDTDFAAETASLTRGQILQQAGTAMLAQANSLPNGVLALLRG